MKEKMTSKGKKRGTFQKHVQYCKSIGEKNVSQGVFYTRVKKRGEKKAIETPNMGHGRPQLQYGFNSLSS